RRDGRRDTQDGPRGVLLAAQARDLDAPILGESTTVGMLPHLQALLLVRWIREDLDAYPRSSGKDDRAGRGRPQRYSRTSNRFPHDDSGSSRPIMYMLTSRRPLRPASVASGVWLEPAWTTAKGSSSRSSS